jgi:hypothetical protein
MRPDPEVYRRCQCNMIASLTYAVNSTSETEIFSGDSHFFSCVLSSAHIVYSSLIELVPCFSQYISEFGSIEDPGESTSK